MTRNARRSRLDDRGTEFAAFASITAVVVGAYWLTHPPLFDPAGDIDPWLYTSLWVDFTQIYHTFHGTYYAARLPWIIPGYALNLLLSPRASYFAIHTVFFFGGGLAAYAMLRRHFGVNAALIGYAWLIGSQMYFDAHRWDYWDGAVITFILVGLFFGTSSGAEARWPWRMVFAGFFLAAAFATNIYTIILITGLPILYAGAIAARPARALAWRIGRDLAAFALGIALLVGSCALFARLNGGPTWFIGPQITAAQAIKSSDYRVPFHVWAPMYTRILAPIFLLVAIGVGVAGRRLAQRGLRMAVASAAYLAIAALLLVAWELAGGSLLEYIYYFSPLLPAMTLCLGGVAYALGSETWSSRHAFAVVGGSVAAVLAPLLYIYRDDVATRVGRDAYELTVILMIAGIVAIGASRAGKIGRIAGWVAAGALFLVVAASAYALDASEDVWANGASTPTGGETFTVGLDAMSFVKKVAGPRIPMFWYDQLSGPRGAYISIQSLYYYGDTALGFAMPKFGSGEAQRLDAAKPDAIVLFCDAPGCSGAPAVLRRHGFAGRFVGEKHFESGSISVWVAIYRVR